MCHIVEEIAAARGAEAGEQALAMALQARERGGGGCTSARQQSYGNIDVLSALDHTTSGSTASSDQLCAAL